VGAFASTAPVKDATPVATSREQRRATAASARLAGRLKFPAAHFLEIDENETGDDGQRRDTEQGGGDDPVGRAGKTEPSTAFVAPKYFRSERVSQVAFVAALIAAEKVLPWGRAGP